MLAEWRYVHIRMVQKMIGTRHGTGGSSGYYYLRRTLGDRYKIFPDLHNIAAFLIPCHYMPKLPSAFSEEFDNAFPSSKSSSMESPSES
jgi:tryptophan 2,3-dioxygenase